MDTAGSARVTCGFCGGEAVDVYYQIGDAVACARCKEAREAGPTGSRLGRFLRATAFGFVAGVVGAALWYGVRRLTGYEIGLIAIVVGFLVGAAVRIGSGGRGGWRYQILAVLLTYFSVALNYAPDVADALSNGADGVGTRGFRFYVTVLVIAVAAPFFGGFDNLLGLLIIGFGLWQAWKMNAGTLAEIGGPFRIGAARVPAPPPAPEA